MIPAQSVSPYFRLIFSNAYRVIVVTDQRILVCRCGRIAFTPVGEVEREVPRGTRIGPATGVWYKTESLGKPLYIYRRFYKDVAEADALAAAGPGPGPGPGT